MDSNELMCGDLYDRHRAGVEADVPNLTAVERRLLTAATEFCLNVRPYHLLVDVCGSSGLDDAKCFIGSLQDCALEVSSLVRLENLRDAKTRKDVNQHSYNPFSCLVWHRYCFSPLCEVVLKYQQTTISLARYGNFKDINSQHLPWSTYWNISHRYCWWHWKF